MGKLRQTRVISWLRLIKRKAKYEALKKRIKKKEGMEINKIYCESNLETMKRMPNNYVDLTVTSPPYDELRDYNGYSFPLEEIAKELFRVTKEGGVVVWVVGDSTINGSESLTSFKQAIYFVEICGFNLHDTMIYQKNSYPFPPSNRYYQQFEYMFVFSKGKPKTTNLLKCESGNKKRKSTQRNKDGSTTSFTSEGNKERIMDNVWLEDTGYMRTTKDKEAYKHPAMFPESLSEKHILTWSNEGDLVYDCFMGSGTTAKMALLNNRNYIGSEISKEYCQIAEQRLKMCGGLFFNSFQTELSNEAGTKQLAYNGLQIADEG